MTEPRPRGRVLVVTTVHPPDDPRIRHKTIPSLQQIADVRYATASPCPTDHRGLDWCRLAGPRPIRAARALAQMLRSDVDVVVAHDPELLPALLLTARLRGIPVVLDVHENLLARAQRHVDPRRPMGRRMTAGVRRVLRHLEGTVLFTLAEDGYQASFSRPHPVFPNHPVAALLPRPTAMDRYAPIVYMGDVTVARGALVLLRAVALARVANPLLLIGRCATPLQQQIRREAASLGVQVELTGWLRYEQALARASSAAVATCPLTDTPNYRQSLPTKVLEYLAMGVPVVASDLPGTAATIADLPGVTLVRPDDVFALAEGLRTAMDPSFRAAAAEGCGTIRQRYRWPTAQVAAFYGDLLARSRRPMPRA